MSTSSSQLSLSIFVKTTTGSIFLKTAIAINLSSNSRLGLGSQVDETKTSISRFARGGLISNERLSSIFSITPLPSSSNENSTLSPPTGEIFFLLNTPLALHS